MSVKKKGMEFVTHNIEWLIHPLTRVVLTFR